MASNIPFMMGGQDLNWFTGFSLDLSLFVTHKWHDFIWWLDMSDKQEKLGRWLGPRVAQFGGGGSYPRIPFKNDCEKTSCAIHEEQGQANSLTFPVSEKPPCLTLSCVC